MKHDDFGDRMKAYERVYTDTRISVDEVLCVRIDGKNFSNYTKNFVKPFDSNLSDVMIQTTKDLIEETHANIGYTQSDEITLIFTPTEKAHEYLYGGKVSKLNSILASMTAGFFQHEFRKIGESYWHGNGIPFFDARSFAVPTVEEASNVLLWRAQDARKNSISCFFRYTLGHSRMNGLSGREMIEVLKSEGYDWHALEGRYKYGTIVKSDGISDYYFGDLSFENRVKELYK